MKVVLPYNLGKEKIEVEIASKNVQTLSVKSLLITLKHLKLTAYRKLITQTEQIISACLPHNLTLI